MRSGTSERVSADGFSRGVCKSDPSRSLVESNTLFTCCTAYSPGYCIAERRGLWGGRALSSSSSAAHKRSDLTHGQAHQHRSEILGWKNGSDDELRDDETTKTSSSVLYVPRLMLTGHASSFLEYCKIISPKRDRWGCPQLHGVTSSAQPKQRCASGEGSKVSMVICGTKRDCTLK